jgi:transposase-like protein
MKKSGIKRYTKEEREDLVQLYRQSDYSASRFCQEMGLSYPTLKRWLGDETAKVSLVEVVVEEIVPAESLRMNIRLPNGIECELRSKLTSRETITLIRELKGC